jgi:hypothetical protein
LSIAHYVDRGSESGGASQFEVEIADFLDVMTDGRKTAEMISVFIAK